MRIFHCDACGELVYFENTSCLNCGTALAYLPDVAEVRALNPTNEERWRSRSEHIIGSAKTIPFIMSAIGPFPLRN
jgi:hypothetical protein